ncbi:MAG: ATP-binding protein [Planctomycetes bacterium]|nr:ATP-binding protein [Planctomycetota bacterium]
MEDFVKNCGNSHRTFKTSLVFAYCDSSSGMESAARDFLAWDAVVDDTENMKRLDDQQKKQVKINLERAERDLTAAVFRTYKCIAWLDKTNNIKKYDMGHLTPSSGSSLSQVIFQNLGPSVLDEVSDGVSALKIVNNWPPTKNHWTVKSVRDAFFSTPKLPRLLKGDSIKRTIADGVMAGHLGYCALRADGSVKLLRFKESLSEGEIDLSEDFAIVNGDTAQQMKEPPRLSRLDVVPNSTSVHVSKQFQFQVHAFDQYDQLFDAGTVVWGASGGEITNDGLFTAGAAPGVAEASANVGDKTAVAAITVLEKSDHSGGSSGASGTQKTIQWSGEIPAQKWNQFYMKVLVKLVQNPGLKLHVRLEAPGDTVADKSKVEEAKSGLEELGLNSKLTID